LAPALGIALGYPTLALSNAETTQALDVFV
jgi:hypothetical protein